MAQKRSTTNTPLWVRITAVTMALLTASGVLTYLVMLIIGLFS